MVRTAYFSTDSDKLKLSNLVLSKEQVGGFIGGTVVSGNRDEGDLATSGKIAIKKIPTKRVKDLVKNGILRGFDPEAETQMAWLGWGTETNEPENPWSTNLYGDVRHGNMIVFQGYKLSGIRVWGE